MSLPRFSFTDLPDDHNSLRTVATEPSARERMWQRVQFGTRAACTASALVVQGDRRPASLVTGLAAWLDPPDLDALVALNTPAATDALSCALAASWTPAPIRVAAADALAKTTPTVSSLAVLYEVSESATPPVRPAALAALDAQLRVAIDDDLAARARTLRTRARLAKTWTGVRRQELQREVASGALAPAPVLACSDSSFFATLVPPIHDGAREALVPALLTNVRDPNDEARKRTFGLLHGRWLLIARQPVSALARFTKLRGSDAKVPAMAAEALGAMGAVAELVTVVVSGTPSVRAAALTTLESVAKQGLAGIAAEIVPEACESLEAQGDTASAARLRARVAGL